MTGKNFETLLDAYVDVYALGVAVETGDVPAGYTKEEADAFDREGEDEAYGLSSNLITITREDAVRMVGMAHHSYSWETAERMTRVAMLFGPKPQGETEDTVVVLDRLTMPAHDFNEIKAIYDEMCERYPKAEEVTVDKSCGGDPDLYWSGQLGRCVTIPE